MIRRRVVLVVLVVLFAATGLFAWKRGGDLSVNEASAGGAGPSDAGATASVASGADAGGPAVRNADASAGSDAEAAKLARTLRVVSPDIELLAPGIVANDGMKPSGEGGFADDDLEVAFSAADGMEEVRAALARGGAEEDGADIAVVSLPSFVASYEQLRALKPEVFFVTGWSRGREALATDREDALLDPPDGDSIEMRGAGGEPATFLSLFAMDLAGIPLEDVELSGEVDDDVSFAAVGRSHPDFDESPEEHRLRLSTADALGLIPFVAIAPHGFVENHREALFEWTSTWLEGKETLAKDVPKAGRLIASEAEDVDALEMIDLLGWIEFASPVDNARVAGLSGRVAATLDRLFRITWRIWRGSGVLTTPVPKAFPITTEVIMHLVRTRDDAEGGTRAGSAASGEGDPEGEVIAIYRYLDDELDEKAFVEKVGLLADIFRRSRLRVTVDWNRPRTADMIEKSRERFDIPESRLVDGRKVPGEGTASVEIFEVQ